MPVQELPKLGSTLGRYRLVSQLGAGAMGVVYKAHDTLLDATICVKVLSPSAGRSPETLGRFRREALLARRITHPGVCRLFDLHEESGTHFLTMEYVDGIMLRDAIVDDGTLDVVATMKILEGIASGLAAAWTVGVVHRDLKPRNIMIRKDGSPCILDFGIATAGDVDELTRPGIALGTMHYIAPEVWQGLTATHQSDLYALGIIGYNCLTGRMPFRTDDGSLLEQMAKSRPPPPSQFRRGVPPQLDALILSLIAFDPKDRPTDGRAVQRILRDLLRARGAQGATVLDGDTFSTSDANLPIVGTPSTDTATTVDDPVAHAIAAGQSSGTRAVPPMASAGGVAPVDLGVTRVLPAPLPSDETLAPRSDSVPVPVHFASPVSDSGEPPTLPASASAFAAGGPLKNNEGLSHSLRIEGVTQHHHVQAAAIERSVNHVDFSVATDEGSNDGRSRSFSKAAAIAALVVVVVVGVAVFVPKSETTAESTVDDNTAVSTVADVPIQIPPDGPVPTTIASDPSRVTGGTNEPPKDVPTPPVAPIVATNTPPPDVVKEPHPGESQPAVIGPTVPKADPKRPHVTAHRPDDAARTRIGDALSTLKRAEQGKGILRGDLPKLDILWSELRKDEKRGDTTNAEHHVEEALRIVEAARIDKSFIEVKLARFNMRFDDTSDAKAKERATPVMTEVLNLKSKSRFDDANRRLNDGFRILGQRG